MALDRNELEPMLDGLPEKIRWAVAARLAQVNDAEDASALIKAIEFEEHLRPLVERVRAGDRDAFNSLWNAIRNTLRGTIRRALLFPSEENFREVESQVMETLWLKRAEYNASVGSYMTWARTIARNLARWHRPGGSREVELNDVHTAPGNLDIPPSACFAEVLRLVQEQEPKFAMAFLFNKYLGWKPEFIASKLGVMPFPEVLKILEREVVSHYPVLRGFGALLAPLRKRLEGNQQTLSSLVKEGTSIEAAISHWSTDAARRVANLVLGQVHNLLALVCRLRAPSYERLAFGWCTFLRRTPGNLAALRDSLLITILNVFCAEYVALQGSPAGGIAVATVPLRDQIFPQQYLRECERDEMAADIAGWRDRIRSMLMGSAGAAQHVAFAYISGALPGLKGPNGRIRNEGGPHDDVRKSSAHG